MIACEHLGLWAIISFTFIDLLTNSYKCVAFKLQIVYKGMILIFNHYFCLSFFADIDECSAGTDTCDTDLSSCTNNVGSFTCTCLDGYTDSGDGLTCIGM